MREVEIFPDPEVIDCQYRADPNLVPGVDDAHRHRRELVDDIRLLGFRMPELPEPVARETYEWLRELERKLVAPSSAERDYANGWAETDDNLRVIIGEGELLITAEHATDPVRAKTGLREGADHGTAALAAALSTQFGTAVIPIGRQTGNANVDTPHPLKEQIRLILPKKQGFLSVHGMAPGKIEHQFDPTEVHGVLGLGAEPGVVSYEAARSAIRGIRETLGLKFVIGNDTVMYPYVEGVSPILARNADGALVTTRLAAIGPGTTTNYAIRVMKETGRALPAAQLELSRTIRLLPHDMEYRDPKAAHMAVYMGYLACKQICRIMSP